MKPIRVLLGALAALMLLPASALAQSVEPAGSGDNYLQPIVLANQQNPLPLSPSVLGFTVDTTNYTTQNDASLFGGNGQEFNQCGNSIYGKTVWAVFYTDRYGRVDLTASGFDSVIGLASFDSPSNPAPKGGLCTDRLLGTIESFNPDFLPTVKKNHWYAIQVGGAQQQDGSIPGGLITVYAELLKPQEVQGDAGVSWTPARGGVKLSLVRAGGPKGAKVKVSCLKKSCGSKSFTSKKPLLKQTFLKSNPMAKFTTRLKTQPEAEAHEAATTNVFQNKTLKNGARLVVTVQETDQIGEMFYWDVKNNKVGTKHILCIEPDGKQTAALGKCDGK
jgi:hypothetical protein